MTITINISEENYNMLKQELTNMGSTDTVEQSIERDLDNMPVYIELLGYNNI